MPPLSALNQPVPNPKPAKFKLMKDELTITDDNHAVNLYHERDFGHHTGAIFFLSAQGKYLIEADAFNLLAAPISQTPAAVSSFIDEICFPYAVIHHSYRTPRE
jgi:hypothetical protein